MSKFRIEYYPEAEFGGFSDIDGTVLFYSRVNAVVSSESVVLDVGCGRGEYNEDPVPYRRQLRVLRGRVARVIGIDVDEAGQQNGGVDEFRKIVGARWPVDDESIDVCVVDYVLEHVVDVGSFFSEVARVLTPGGVVCLRTTNGLSYVAIAARCLPNRLHAAIVGRVQRLRRAEDVFPTVYACNTPAAIRRALRKSGFDVVAYPIASEPAYFDFSRTLYGFGVGLHRWLPRPVLPVILAFGRKRDAKR